MLMMVIMVVVIIVMTMVIMYYEVDNSEIVDTIKSYIKSIPHLSAMRERVTLT